MAGSSIEPPNLREVVFQVRSNHGPDAVIEAGSVGPADHLFSADLTSPKARQRADLVGIVLDLDFVLQALARLSELGDPPADPVVAQALWGSALVAYARCFVSGARAQLHWSLFNDSPPGVREFHRFIMDMRDKHVAHAVNPFDQVHVGAVLSPPGSASREVLGTVALRTQLVGWDQDGLQAFSNLASEVLAFAQRRAREVEAQLFEEARSMAIEDLYQRGEVRNITPAPSDVRKPTQRPGNKADLRSRPAPR